MKLSNYIVHSELFIFIIINALNFKVDCLDKKPCMPKWHGSSFVCVCNATYCDQFEPLKRTQPSIITKFTSDQTHSRFDHNEYHFSHNGIGLSKKHLFQGDGQTIIVERNQTFQQIIGFGAAFTDATGINIEKLVPELAGQVINEYYGEHGLRFSMGRVPMAGTDFSIRTYTYDDLPEGQEDFNLTHFKLQPEDFKYKIPLIEQAKNVSVHPIKFFASPWSPPAWMKTNGDLHGDGKIKGNPNESYYKSWAKYFVRFLEEYQKQGINFWGLTIQNEPFDGTLRNFSFNCNGMTAEDERDFLFQTLGPTLELSGFGNDKVKMMIIDDQRPFIEKWANVILSHENASKYVSGIAFHWYMNGLTSPEVLDNVHQKYPNYFLISSEACEGSNPFDTERVSLGNWQRGENYAYDIITDLNHHTNAWIDWNMALDENGGPNWSKNFADAAIIVNEYGTEYYKQPMYYALAHFTRFLDPESIRIGLKTNNDYLNAVAFRTPQNSTILIVLNRLKSTIPLKIYDPEYGLFMDEINAHSLQTYVWFD